MNAQVSYVLNVYAHVNNVHEVYICMHCDMDLSVCVVFAYVCVQLIVAFTCT